MRNHRKYFGPKQYTKIKLQKNILQFKLLKNPKTGQIWKLSGFQVIQHVKILFGSVLILVKNCHIFIDLANSVIFMSNLKARNWKYTSNYSDRSSQFKTEKVKAYIINLKYNVQKYSKFKCLIILSSLSLINFSA